MGLFQASETEPMEHFFDLGSGAGKVVSHMALAGYATAATGIELNANRHDAARHLIGEALAQTRDFPLVSGTVNETNAPFNAGIRLLQGDMMTADLSEATAIYSTKPAFQQGWERSLLKSCSTKL